MQRSTAFFICVCTLSISLVRVSMSDAEPSTRTAAETITGTSLAVIEAALPEARSRKLDLSLYRITVQRDDGTTDGKPNNVFVVSFVDVNAPSPARGPGNPGKIPGLEVQLSPGTLKVIKAHYIR